LDLYQKTHARFKGFFVAVVDIKVTTKLAIAPISKRSNQQFTSEVMPLVLVKLIAAIFRQLKST